MPRWYWKLFVYGIILCFCTMFGVDLASRGMNRIEGPGSVSGGAAQTGGSSPAASGSLPEETSIRTGGGRSGERQPAAPSGAPGSGAGTQAPAAGPDAAAGNARAAEGADRAAATPPPKPSPRPLGTGDPLEAGSMNHLGNKLGDLLQMTAQSGMDGVVSMFEWVVK
ncbi:hypothetical protein [Paenibacillus sp. UNC499MF]|uniref:hypothetical protein n=1 Tax=Paenibacillus sp. UNC499MF TaxID=1502751 RepID=UPI00089F8AB1|nr:hypothetical protein [Paenibacillus sp. UNC499MF]SEF48283.1 hypothetical protein SAMN02799616_00195 [Paenibacillus sp. UNC499MF]